MWLVSKTNGICININWIEAMAFEKSLAWVYFPWGNDILKMTEPKLIEETRNLLNASTYDKRKLRLFHEFKNGTGKILIDLSEIKAIKFSLIGIIFYRRYISEEITTENIAHFLANGEIYRANFSEWDDCCFETGN
jgi:hypothetical protein